MSSPVGGPSNNPDGLPLRFPTPEDLQTAIDAYFDERAMFDVPLTVTGLALALDITDETLLNYRKRDGYGDIVVKAKMRIVDYAEKNLYRIAARGPIFALTNIITGGAKPLWVDSKSTRLSGDEDNPIKTDNTWNINEHVVEHKDKEDK